MTPEGRIMREQMITATKAGARVFRNHVGKVRDDRNYLHVFGLGVGTSDLIGWYQGRFLAIEIKAAGAVTSEQRAFINAVRTAGGLAGVSRCDEDTRAIIAGEIRD